MPYKDKEKIKEYYKKYHLKNYSKYKDTVAYKEKNKERCKAYREKHKGKVALYKIKRRLLLKTQCPKWADLEKINQIYINCPVGYHVDHIIPLKGDVVRGLHIESNLQYLTAEENLKKGNRFKV